MYYARKVSCLAAVDICMSKDAIETAEYWHFLYEDGRFFRSVLI